jgi:hypothetical protein
VKDFWIYCNAGTFSRFVCISMIVMACGRGRIAGGSWVNYCAVYEYRRISQLFLK